MSSTNAASQTEWKLLENRPVLFDYPQGTKQYEMRTGKTGDE
jgi:hypothetical protein